MKKIKREETLPDCFYFADGECRIDRITHPLEMKCKTDGTICGEYFPPPYRRDD